MENDLQTQAINRSKGYQNFDRAIEHFELKNFMFINSYDHFYDNEYVNLETIKHCCAPLFHAKIFMFFFVFFFCLFI